jgi:hypothetical protein
MSPAGFEPEVPPSGRRPMRYTVPPPESVIGSYETITVKPALKGPFIKRNLS